MDRACARLKPRIFCYSMCSTVLEWGSVDNDHSAPSMSLHKFLFLLVDLYPHRLTGLEMHAAFFWDGYLFPRLRIPSCFGRNMV
jgi:hypothetical protein